MSADPTDIFVIMARFRADRREHVLVLVTATRGSTPQDAGARMIVTSDGLAAGTVGGGKVEAAAIRQAAELLTASSAPRTSTVEWNLQRDVGMTCGGTMSFYFEIHRPAAWTIALFGAGHVAAALVPVLAPLECRVLCRDPRPDWIACLPTAPNVMATVTDPLADSVADLPDDAFAVLITQGHATDFPVLRRLLETRNLPFIGVIGSRSKRAVLERELREAGLSAERASAFECPLGLPVGSNHPPEIAISIAAGLLAARDRHRGE